MTNAEPTDTTTAVAEHGAVTAPETTASKKAAQQQEVRAQESETCQGREDQNRKTKEPS